VLKSYKVGMGGRSTAIEERPLTGFLGLKGFYGAQGGVVDSMGVIFSYVLVLRTVSFNILCQLPGIFILQPTETSA